MKILKKAFGMARTNCYILSINDSCIVIDPGEGSYDWIKENSSNLLAVLNTHGHYDHAYDDKFLQNNGHKIYIHKDDAFLVKDDPMRLLKYTCIPDVLVTGGDEFKFCDFNVKFHHFPGHTPGCCMIEVNGVMFSGDFLFFNSIGRYDFPFSNSNDMKNSLLKALEIKENFTLYPGHGESTTLENEKDTMRYFLKNL